jgi:hypothetical protein
MWSAFACRCSKMGLLSAACALVLALLGPSIASAQTPAPTTTNQAQEQRKLQLEIDKLSRETSSSAEVRAWLSASTIFIALVAASLGAYQYFRDQRLASRVRVEQQFAESLGTLSDYSQTGNLASARVVWALENLKELTSLASNPDAYRRRVTDVITTGVLADANFEERPHVRLDTFCLERWPDYGRWLGEHPPERGFLLYRYQQALRVLAERKKEYFRDMDFGKKGFEVERYSTDEADYLLFTSLARGYDLHLTTLPANERITAVDAFGDAVGNRALARKMFAGGTT